jgi:hypothetical protein
LAPPTRQRICADQRPHELKDEEADLLLCRGEHRQDGGDLAPTEPLPVFLNVGESCGCRQTPTAGAAPSS